MGGYVAYTLIDVSTEKTTHSVPMTIITDLNLTAQDGLMDAYTTALGNLVIGTVSKKDFHAEVEEISSAIPANNFAQREIKLLIRYQGSTTGDIFRVEIGTPDLASLTLISGTDLVELADAGIMAAWVTAFEALARSPDDPAETVTVISAQVVGRNI